MIVGIIGARMDFNNYQHILDGFSCNLSDNGFEFEYVYYLSKQTISDSYMDKFCAYVYVEISPFIADKLYCTINREDTDNDIYINLANFLETLYNGNNTDTTVDNLPAEVESNISTVDSTLTTPSLYTGVILEINNKYVHVNKEDFDKLIEVKKFVDEYGYKIVEVIVSDNASYGI